MSEKSEQPTNQEILAARYLQVVLIWEEKKRLDQMLASLLCLGDDEQNVIEELWGELKLKSSPPPSPTQETRPDGQDHNEEAEKHRQDAHGDTQGVQQAQGTSPEAPEALQGP